MRGRGTSRSGFSLLEALVVLSLVGALLYLGAGSFLNLRPKYRLESAVWDIRSALNAARYKALYENASVRVRLGEARWTMETYDAATKSWKPCRTGGLEGVLVEATNTPLFTGRGTVSGLATITVSNSWGAYKLAMAVSGRIKTTRVS